MTDQQLKRKVEEELNREPGIKSPTRIRGRREGSGVFGSEQIDLEKQLKGNGETLQAFSNLKDRLTAFFRQQSGLTR